VWVTDSVAAGSANLPAVADAGGYPAPAMYFRDFSGSISAEAYFLDDITRTLNDPQFRPEKSAEGFIAKLEYSSLLIGGLRI
jgi:hypothetical protein